MRRGSAALILAVAVLCGSGCGSGSTGQGGSAGSSSITNLNSAAQTLPDAHLLDAAGNTVDPRVQVQAARVTLLVFFATYDTPWSDNVKLAKEIHRDLAKDGVLVLGIDEQEPQATLTAFIAREGLAFPVLRDPDGAYLRSIGTPGSVEQMLVVDSAGNVIARRGRNSDSVALIKEALSSRTRP